MAEQKEVLVSIGENKRVVQFSGSRDKLRAAIGKSFEDILGNGGLRDSAHIQMWEKKWDGFVDLQSGQQIPDKCKLNVINVVKQTATPSVDGNQETPPALKIAKLSEATTSVNGMQATTSVDGNQETFPALKIAKLSETKQVPYCTTSVSEEPQNGTSQLKEVQKACAQPTKFWSGREKLFVYFINPDILKGWKCGDGQMNLETILAWAEKWNDHASAGDIPKFERTKELQDADIRVKFVEVGDCWSKVGTDAESVVSPDPTMHLALKGQQSDFQKYLVIHEFGHSLGLEHEHQRYDFWEVATKVIDLDKMKADSRMVNTDFERDILEHKDSSKFKTSLYDSESVMHYWFDVNWLKHDKHKTEEGVDGDKLLTPEERVILKGIHRRNNSFVDRPSKKDMDFLKGYYAKKQGGRRAKNPSGPSNPPAASGFSVTVTTENTTKTVVTRRKLSDVQVLELVDDVNILDEEDISDVLHYLNDAAGHWQTISRNLHVKGDKITELIHSGQPAPTCLENAITDWLRLNYNHQRFGKPTWKKVAESVVEVNKKLFIRIAAKNSVMVVPDSEQLTQTPTAQGGPTQTAVHGGSTQPAGTYRVLTINDNLIYVKTAVWEVKKKWEEIGILLPGVEQDTINSVQGSRETDNGERLNKVLSKWIYTGKARINHLLTALRHTTVGRGDIADKICGLKGDERAKVGL